MADNKLVEIKNLSKRFETLSVLDDISIDVLRGENLVVFGRSGQGKSVLLKCIIGLMHPDAGKIYIKGNDISLSTRWTGDILDSSYFKLPQYEQYRQPGNFKVPFWLQPDKYYCGAAWYRKEITIPSNWNDKSVELYFERCHWQSTVWIDDQFI